MPPSQRAIALDYFIRERGSSCQLESWTSFIREMQVPADLAAAFVTGRPELVKTVIPRAMDAREVKILLDLIANLLETNEALREHAHDVATSITIWAGSFKQLETVGRQLERFAKFERVVADDDLEA